jgi:Rrf2 family protein
MLFSQTAEYALRAAACLAAAAPEALLSSEHIAAEASIPAPYVPKVLRPLVEAGLVEARRGRGGGFRLARPAGHICLHEVLDAAGALPQPDRCAFGHDRCRPELPCPLHDQWTILQDAVLGWARAGTLADLAGRRAPG